MDRRRTYLLLAVLAALSLSSCASDPDSELEHELEHLEETVMRHEQLIAECMRGRGWEYVPALPSDVLLEREHLLAEAQGREFDPSAIDLPEDPNDTIVAQLSEVEKEARAADYWGNLQEGGTDPGCYYSTYEQAWGGTPIEELGPDDLTELEAAFEGDPRVIAARERYQSCMASSGYRVAGPTDIFQQYLEREEQLSGRLRESGGDPQDAPEMQALQAEKSAAFEAHDRCIEDYREVEGEVRAELMQDRAGSD